MTRMRMVILGLSCLTLGFLLGDILATTPEKQMAWAQVQEARIQARLDRQIARDAATLCIIEKGTEAQTAMIVAMVEAERERQLRERDCP